MKTNEAPEKLYLDTTDNPDNVWLRAFRPPFNTCGIEYTRTDAFIEKATSYIQQHWIWNTKMIEDFKNYMKGE
jgi:hypothetical protein